MNTGGDISTCVHRQVPTMSPPRGRPKEGSLPLRLKARSAKGAPTSPPRGRPKEGSLPPGGKARSAKGAL